MSWVKLDDGFFRNPKAIAAGPNGRALYLAGLCFCAQGLTDGVIDKRALQIVAADAAVKPSTADVLVREGLWLEDDAAYVVPDYLSYNPSRAQVLAEREAARIRQQSHRDRQRESAERSASPSPPVPDGSNSSSSTTSVDDPVDDDDERITQVWPLLAERRFKGVADTVKNPRAWKAKVALNERLEHQARARQLCADYPPDQLTVDKLADVLSGSDSVLRYLTRREAS